MSDLPVPDPNADFRTQALDIQHDTDPARDHGIARRIPHLGHALLFFLLALTFIFMASAVLLIALHTLTPAVVLQHPFAGLMSLILAYATTFAVSVPIFRMLWNRSFLDGISWTWRAARLRWWQLLLLGCVLSVIAQLLEHLVKTPVTSDLTKLFQTPRTAWLAVFFGICVAPVSEEIAFRGFLLPAFSTAYDWLALERTPTSRDRWQRSTNHTRGAFLFAALLSSVAFVALHGSQLHWAHGPLIILFVMSLVFSAVRIQTRSVAAATLVHLAYDGLIMIQIIIGTDGFRHLDKLM
jgi:membrane protease YdiL (CAAX protease family)